jgi:hypothetical protein
MHLLPRSHPSLSMNYGTEPRRNWKGSSGGLRCGRRVEAASTITLTIHTDSTYNQPMAALARTVLVVLLLAANVMARDHADVSLTACPTASPVHRFWDHTNVLLFSGMVVFRGLDYASTRNFQARGREEILLPDDVVNNSAGFVSLEAAGVATSVGISYILHRTGHHRLERWLSIGHIGVAGFGVVRNYSLESKHP